MEQVFPADAALCLWDVMGVPEGAPDEDAVPQGHEVGAEVVYDDAALGP